MDLSPNGSLIDDISWNQLALIIEGLFYDVVRGDSSSKAKWSCKQQTASKTRR
jgi:hypothetical protein